MRRLALAAALLLPTAGFTQGHPAPMPNAVAGGSLVVSVLTFGPGDAVWERFGHNAIRVRDLATGEDLAYNWGMFDFDQPKFIRRFLSGDTKYWVEAFPTQLLLDYYVRTDRESIEQVLALTPAERAELAAFVRANVLEQNKYYRYDYFLDNCSTRVRDAIDRVLRGTLERRFVPITTPWSYRGETVRLLTPSPWPQAGTDFALGPRADRPLTAWEAMFIPMRLRDYLREVTISTSAGTIPLVSAERVLHRAQRASEPAEARRIALGWWGPILGAWMLLLAPAGAVSRRRTRIPAAVMAGLWLFVTGLLGTILLGMWLGSAHVFWYENLNLLVVSPLALAAAGPVVLAILRGTTTSAARWLFGAVVGQALLALLLAPLVTQRLGGPLLLVLPVHLGLAMAVWRHQRAARESVTAARAT